MATFNNSKNDLTHHFEQNGESKQKNSSLIESLGKFDVIQQPNKSFERNKSPTQLKNTPKRNSPKRQRIKYDIGDEPNNVEIQKYDTEGINYSRYQAQMARSSYRPRASLSYQRLPYFQAESEYEDKSIRNSRNNNPYG